ncbi:MAG: hypothetical protein ACYC7E_15170 [Armatimonadota bacterium]
MRISFLLLSFLLALCSLPAFSALTVTDGPGPDGKRLVVVENAAFKMTVNPAISGRVSSFIWKRTGTEWVLPGNAGLFMDHVWQQTWPGELLSRAYDVKVLESGPQRAVVQASITIEGKGDKGIEGVKLIRTMTVTGDNPRVDVTMRLENPTTEPRAPGLWVQNVINIGGSRDNVWTWRPTTRGVIRASFDTKLGLPIPEGYKDDFAFDPIAGWSAETCPPTAEGAVFYMDYNYLRCLYDNAGSQSLEWWCEQAHLAPGEAFETRFTFYPFQGMTAVTHATMSVIGDLQMVVKGTELTLANRLLAGPEPKAGIAKVKLQLIDYDTGQEITGKEFADVKISGTPVEQSLPIPNAPLAKNLLARATVTTADGQQQVYEAYRHGPAVMGTEKQYKTTRPPRIRPIARPATIEKTPHEGFRILHLRGMFHDYYRLPDAAKAIDAELKYGSYRIFVYGPSLSYFPNNYKELMSYDVMVMNNVPIEALDEVTMQYLRDYVTHGGALLVIGGHWAFGGGGYKGTELEALLPMTVKGLFDVQPVKNGKITPILPGAKNVGTLWIQDGVVRPEAQVLLRAGKAPFWVQWQVGAGTVAVLGGVCYGEKPKGMELFWEWSGWPQWLGSQLKSLVAETGKP